MNFEEYMRCHEDNSNNFVDDDFGTVDPCYDNDDDSEYIDNGLGCNQNHCWRPDPPKRLPKYGTLNVYSKLECPDGEPLEQAPINLYRVDNGCEKLVATKNTDENGLATFTCLEDGVYRAEQNLDPCLFCCPEYYPSAQFAIRPGHKTQRMYIVHKRKTMDPCLMRTINRSVNAAVKKALGNSCCSCHSNCGTC